MASNSFSKTIRKVNSSSAKIEVTLLQYLFLSANCGDPTPEFCSVTPSQADGIYSEGTSVTFTCYYGYNLTGAASSTCNSQGSWNPQPPTCNLSN